MSPITGWYAMTIIIPLCWAICLMLTFIQVLSIKWFKTKSQTENNLTTCTKNEIFLLYGIYSAGILCSTQCFALHLSNLLADWYCIYGVGICTVFYFGEKAFLYGFFLERSKSVQVLLDKQILPSIVMKFVLPAYIALYFITFSILSLMEYRGRAVDINNQKYINNNKNFPTSCLFWKFHPWMFNVGAIVDGITCTFLLLLFIYPLYTSIQSFNKVSNSKNSDSNKLWKVMRINTICSAVCVISSVCTMAVVGSASIDYIWLLGNIDMLINSIFTFMIPDCNRKYMLHLSKKKYMKWCCNNCCNKGALSKERSVSTILGSVTSKKMQSLSTIYEEQPKDYNTISNTQIQKKTSYNNNSSITILDIVPDGQFSDSIYIHSKDRINSNSDGLSTTSNNVDRNDLK